MSHSKTFLCRCEDVTLEDFRAAYREGFTELESLKRYTGVGTGFCQGKGCLSEAATELARLRDISPAPVNPAASLHSSGFVTTPSRVGFTSPRLAVVGLTSRRNRTHGILPSGVPAARYAAIRCVLNSQANMSSVPES